MRGRFLRIPSSISRTLCAAIVFLRCTAMISAEEVTALPSTTMDVSLAERPDTGDLEQPRFDIRSEGFSPSPTIRRRSLSEIDLSAAPPPGSPTMPNPLQASSPADDAFAAGRNDPKLVAWVAPNQSHLPVYFEEVGVERYGQTICPPLQPLISGGKFLANAALLPYKMGVDSPRQFAYDVGLARPGSPTPAVRETLPFSVRGLLYQGAAVTGAGFLLHP
jgi:hypothetical protein